MGDLPVPGAEGLTRRCPFSVIEEYEKVRDTSGVAPLDTPSGRPAWLLASFEETKATLADPRFASAVNEPPPLDDGNPIPGWFFGLDGAEHSRYRKLLTGQFTMRAARKAAPRIRAIVVEHLEQMRRQGSSADLFEAFAWPAPARVICDLLGVPRDMEALLTSQIEIIDGDDPRADRLGAMQTMWDALVGLTAAKRLRPGDDMLSDLLAGNDVSDQVGASFALALRIAGHAPVSHVVGMGVLYHLTENGLDGRFGDTGRRDATVEELLRFLPTNNLGVLRLPTEDVQIRGQALRAGQPVVASLAVANRDPARFEDAESFRPELRHPSHLAFGYGPHQCLGHNFARVELGVIFEELFGRFPGLRLAVALDEVPMQDSAQSYGVTALPVAW
ncbi:cytochrome P450 [Glycomyces luteolus]|uniref:Cytochrome P450 n=1 Tax=Glycomyces luteolus TaxID=2670330 RepID=A0A9X3PB83_9ACTN|nr:cytochrome P450 [Glycomyces luteolus]MDA1360916.1 cytochrome P450 [Glycomyces luteolus]